jgi:hypothetical protein
MFGNAAPGFEPDQAARAAADATFTPLVAAVQRCRDEGALVGPPAERIALFLWAVSHGVVSLEISGQLPAKVADPEAAYRDAMIHSVTPFLPR